MVALCHGRVDWSLDVHGLLKFACRRGCPSGCAPDRWPSGSLTLMFMLLATGAGQAQHHLHRGLGARDLHCGPQLQGGHQLPVALQAVGAQGLPDSGSYVAQCQCFGGAVRCLLCIDGLITNLRSLQGGVDKKRLHFIEGGQAGNREVCLVAISAATCCCCASHLCLLAVQSSLCVICPCRCTSTTLSAS